MKSPFLSLLLIAGLLGPAANGSDGRDTTKNQVLITIGQKTFTATLEDTATTTAFKAMLPLQVNMKDMNANEKVTDLPGRLPTEDTNPRRIQTGDLMIWTSRSLVLFYESFPTPYSYTRLGRVDDTSGLAAALGAGDVSVSFELNPGN